MTFFPQIILIGEQGYQHQANRHLEMGEVEGERGRTSHSKGKGKKEEVWGEGDKENLYFLLAWPGLAQASLPTTLTLEASTAREKIGIYLIPGGNFKLPSV